MPYQNQLAPPSSWRRLLLGLLALTLAVAGVTIGMTTAYANSCTALLPDGGFETNVNWTSQSKGGYALLSNYRVRSGQQAAYLGGTNLAQDSLFTTVSLPADQRIDLRFWWQVRSDETGSAWDGFSLVLTDAGGAPQQVLLSLDNSSRQGVWQQAAVDLSAFGGQTVQLHLTAQTDATLLTEFFIDDVELTACNTGSSQFNIFLPFMRR